MSLYFLTASLTLKYEHCICNTLFVFCIIYYIIYFYLNYFSHHQALHRACSGNTERLNRNDSN